MSETCVVNRKRRCSGDSNDDATMKRSATENDNKDCAQLVTALDSTLSATDWSFSSLQKTKTSDSIISVCDVSESDEILPLSPKQLLPETNSVTEDVIESSGASENLSKPDEEIISDSFTDPVLDVGPIEPKNLFQISFHDINTFTELKPVIEQAIRSAMLQLKRTITITSDNLQLIVRESNEPGASEECCFIVDALPTVESQTGETIAVVPKYRLSVRKVFNNDQPEPLNEDDECTRPARNSCWNCDGEHAMRDCTEPRNFNKVRQNRAKFTGKTERYHVDVTQRFGTFVPGEISNDLRKALGLHRNELPLHIYRMRELGYPPGWLENAKVSQSGLALFDANGSAISADAEPSNTQTTDNEFKYDLRKIVSFPGFNVIPKADVKQNKFFPPMLAFQSKEAMLQALQHSSVQSHRVKKLKNIPVDAVTIADDGNLLELTTAEMDIDDGLDGELIELDMPPLPAEKPLSLTPPPLPPADESGSASPSLDDLQEQQERLLAALNESTSTVVNATLADDSLIDDILALDDTHSTCAASTVDTDLETSNISNNSMNVTEPLPETPKTNLRTAVTLQMDEVTHKDDATTSLNSSKKLVFGTPLIESASPFTILPSGSCWSAGVSDIMDFENLPESIGKYKQMKGVINKVRDAVKQLNDEYD